MAAAFAQRGYVLKGFDAKVRSTVLPGSGLSSSAAFEVLIGRILNGLFADNAVSAIEIAQIGQYAENVYYGKPSGLMDQMASSVGGLVFIDFNDPKTPIVEKVDYDFAHSGYAWIDTLENERLIRAVMKLNDKDLELLTYVTLEGHGQKELAKKWGCTQAAIAIRMQKIKKIFQTTL